MLEHIEFQCRQPGKISVIQLTDTHISAGENELLAGVNTADTLAAVIAAVNRREAADLALLTGDLVSIPSAAAYEKLAGLLGRLELPVFCLPGNHDDPQLMRGCLNSGNLSAANFLTCGPWAIILLNTHKADNEGGYLSASELSFLADALARSADRHVLICLHHHPVRIHSPWMDRMKLENSDALFRILDQSGNVRGIIWGHIHQAFSESRNGVLLLGSPSTCVQFRPRSDKSSIDTKPPAYRSLELNENGAIQTRIHWQRG